MKSFMMLAAMLAMTIMTATPALAQTEQGIMKTGVDSASLLTLGVGVLLVAGGFLVRRIFGRF